jgi:predicted dehydrogenase
MRIGIVGCGLIGQKRAAAATGHEIPIVCDVNAERAEALARSVGGRGTNDWRELVAKELDLVIVATTHDHLAEITLAAVQAGKHVLVEKPAARTAVELAPVVAAATLHRRLVKVGFNHRFHPALMKARELVDRGELGPLMFIRGRYGHGGRVGYEQEWRCVREISGGGELIDQGSHLVDLSRWFLGELTLEYSACPTYYWKIGVDDNCFLALKGRSGEMAWLHATWTEWKNLFSFEISGRDGKLMIEGLGGSYGVERLAFYKMRPEMGPPETTLWEYPFPDKSWQLEFDEFVHAIHESRQPLGNIHDALANLKIVEQAYARPGA